MPAGRRGVQATGLTEQAEGLLELGHCRGKGTSWASGHWASKTSGASSRPQLTLLVAQLLRHGAECVKQAGWVREWRCGAADAEFILRAGGRQMGGAARQMGAALRCAGPPSRSILNALEQLGDLQQECAGAR